MERQFEPAFPILDDCNGLGLALRDAGMSLRDYFAAKAMQGFVSTLTGVNFEPKWSALATDAYTMADAMMKAREL